MCCNVAGCNNKAGTCRRSRIGKWLLTIGGINWGLIGLGMLFGGMGANWNVVHMLIGSWPVVEGTVYVLVGIAAVYRFCGCGCHRCKNGVCYAHATEMKAGGMSSGTEGKM